MIVRARLLGPFSVSYGERTVTRWPRPSARRMCELVLVSPGQRVSRDLVCEELFADLDSRAAARAVSKALSMARAALAGLDEPGSGQLAPPLLEADLAQIWAVPSVEVDVDVHEEALRAALATRPGRERDDRLVAALAEDGELLADEPYADWAIRARERLEALRQQARLALARDRARGAGQATPDAVVESFQAYFEHDPACEEAAIALIRAYSAQRRREEAAVVFERCTAALEELGLRVSGALAEAYATAAAPPRSSAPLAGDRRTVSILSAEVVLPAGEIDDLERCYEIVADSVAEVIAEVEALGGTVTSVSGTGVQAVFGAPVAHEDDPERAVRAAFRARSRTAALRIGIETGPAVLGPLGSSGKVEYVAVGEVVSTAVALHSRAAPGSVLVGPVTRAAIGHLFTWGADGMTLGAPRPGVHGHPRRRGPLVGRRAELAVLGTAMRDALRGAGSVVVVTGEPGIGKTRLVQEVRKRADSSTLWLGARGTSYASSTPYSLYQQLLANWCGITPDLPEAVVLPALVRALSRVDGDRDLLPPLARMMGLSPGAALGRRAPTEMQRATFAAWHTLVSRLMATRPLVVVLEDLQWADPTSIHLTEHLAGLAAGRPLLFILTSRPGGTPEIGRLVTIGRLSGEAERALARSLIGEEVGQEILDTVLTSVEGNPLFLQERLSSLLETKALVRERDAWRVNEWARQEVPQVLERLVRSRVDRLSPAAKDVIKYASVLGSEFPPSLLATVTASGQSLEPIVAELRAKDLLHEVDGSIKFRHALIQEATYSGLVGAERRQLHGRAAWALEAASQDRLEEVAAVLGRHFAATGERDRALTYLEMAGDHATSAFANDEAISEFHSAMAVAQDADAAVSLFPD